MPKDKIAEEVIKDILQKRNIDYSKLCNKLGIKTLALSKSLYGKRKLKIGEFLSLCVFLKLKVKDFK